MTEPVADWEAYLRTQFPAYLLPQSAIEALSVAEATRFLAALTDDRTTFDNLRKVSVLTPRMAELRTFVDLVTEIVPRLPSITESIRRHWQGGYQGNLDVHATIQLRLQGRDTENETRTPRRHYNLAENIVLRSVCDRLLRMLVDLRKARLLPSTGWSADSRTCLTALKHALQHTRLSEVTPRAVTAHDLAAARAAREPVFRAAARWHADLHASLDHNDPQQIARLVAEGGLLPLDAARRFEIAVTMKLIAQLSDALAWAHERGLIIKGRNDLATMRRGELAVRIYYNQAVLDSGPTDRAAKHYFASYPMRPDITVVLERAGQRCSALVVECKHSADPSYLATGLHEAMLYRHEYAPALQGSVKSVLVTSGPLRGEVRPDDEVIAVSWDAWPPAQVIASLLAFVQ